ncbi:gamma-taxilin [Colias croceus]|uniref:gamma-taxilin n=1 Tax=Colias crocea TaxID=72248 RepID=UPI001E28108E|nr:gamma-taxilin [Colias croceus]
MEVAEEVSKENTEKPIQENDTKEKPPPPQEVPKKNKKEDRLSRDDKNVEQFMKSLNSISSPDEKLAQVCKKYVQTADENKKLQFYIKQSDKRYSLLLKEKEQLQHEYNKTILVKSKLENLCRELQKHNKAIKEESLLKIREEEERRKETQAKFQNTLTEITALLQQNNEKNAKLRDDNISMTEKFKSVVQQYQLREQQVDKMAKQMALESQLSDAKLQKAALEHQAEKERLLAEAEQMKMTLAQYRSKIMELQGTETALKGQLAVYTDKYDEFQNALVKSNQVFGGFKEQMEKMSKKIQKLEKESLSWKSKWETSQTALLDMCGERQAGEERAAATNRQLQQMQSLCRTLQGERTLLLNTLKEHNIERPPLPALPPPPVIAPSQPANDAKVDAMAANCAQLRQSLAHLQTQLNTLTTKKEKEESPKPEPKKKSKSKKNKAQKAAQEKAEETAKEELIEKPSEVKESSESPEEKVDTEAMENLLDAINEANVNLCDLDVVNDNSEIEVKNDDEIKPVDVKNDEEIKPNSDNVNGEIVSENKDTNVSNGVELKPEEDIKVEEKVDDSNKREVVTEENDKTKVVKEENDKTQVVTEE